MKKTSKNSETILHAIRGATDEQIAEANPANTVKMAQNKSLPNKVLLPLVACMAIIIGATALTLGGFFTGENKIEPPLENQSNTTFQATTSEPTVTSVEITEENTPTLEEKISIKQEIPLAGGATLIIGENVEYLSTMGWVLFSDSEEQEILFDSYWGFFAISPDGKRIMYFSEDYGHRGGLLNIFNVSKRSSLIPSFADSKEDYNTIYSTDDFVVTRFVWLDNDNILVIRALGAGSATAGGHVYYYNVENGSYKRIIQHGEHFQINDIKIIGDNLNLTAALDSGGFNYMGDFHQESIQLARIYDLIKANSTLTLDNVPDIRKIQDDNNNTPSLNN